MKMESAPFSNVTGTTLYPVTQGEAPAVANASYDAGYNSEVTLEGNSTKADIVRGYCNYGEKVGS